MFSAESGGHRWQRIPPTEKRGRVQTSTITVAVLDVAPSGSNNLHESDIDIAAVRGSGPGGQNRNKVASCIVAVHKPTGISVRIDSERSQHQNRRIALDVLAARVAEKSMLAIDAARAAERKGQIGSGMRGDKIRTYRVQDDQVVDHRTGKRWTLKNWMRGYW